MELFTINRYDENASKHDPQKEDEILQKLLKKVEKRKRKLKKSKDETVEDEFIDDNIKKVQDVGKIEVKTTASEPEVGQPAADVEKNEDFTVLGGNDFKKGDKVDMVLPPWLAYPTIIANKIQDGSEEEKVNELSYLTQEIKQNLKGMSIEKLFPVQKEVIPWIFQAHAKPFPFRPRDICVSAPTGSGKTLAFAIPIIQILLNRVERKIRALVVLPVNELAQQVYKVFKRLVENTDLSVILLSRACPFPVEQNLLVEEYKEKYYSKVDIVVTTPGRLVEHLHATKGFCLKNLEFLVIDEADRIMEQIQHNWLYHLDTHVRSTSDMFLSGRSAPLCIYDLENELSKQPHKLLFSATLSQDPEKLQNLRLFQPKLFTSVVSTVADLVTKFKENEQLSENKEIRGEFIGKYTTPAELTEQYCITEKRIKPLTLFSLIKQNKWRKFLCFTNSAESAHRLTFVLEFLFAKHVKISELSRNLNPKQRTSVLKDFGLSKIDGLICSDALARGIDIPEVDIVISYDVPRHIKTYIHRVGRTARAGRPGTAITLLNTNELTSFNALLADAGKNSVEEIIAKTNEEEGYAQKYAMALEFLQRSIEYEKKVESVKRKQSKRKAVAEPTEMTLMEKLQQEAAMSLDKDLIIRKKKLIKD